MGYAGGTPTIGDHWGAVEVNRGGADNDVNTGAVAMAHDIVTTLQAEIDTNRLGG
jgi:hypothetical protein